MTTLVQHLTAPELTFLIPDDRGANHHVNPARHLLDPALIIAPHASPTLVERYHHAALNLFSSSSFATTHPADAETHASIFVTSPHHGDGKTCTAFNFAWTLAQSGQSVLLAELNFLRPRLRAALGDLRLRHGLESALHGAARPANTVFNLNSTSLYIAAVRNPTPLAELAGIHAHLNAFLEWATSNFELIVFDCPSVLSREWTNWFSHHAAPALLVTRENHTPQIEIQQAIKLLGPALSGVLSNAARHIPAHPAADPLPRRISPNDGVHPHILQPHISD